ncbi:MAG: YdcF family protein [Kiritimatiellia bacterium]
MKAVFRFFFRLVRAALAALGLLILLAAAAQFTNLPWHAYKSFSHVPGAIREAPTHVLVMGGSGIPGESGLSRTFFGAEAARRHPQAEVLIALPLGTNESYASRAYVDELRLRGVPAKRLRLLAGGRNTREQALRLAEALAGEARPPLVLVVTDPNHVRRTAACIRKAFADRNAAVRLDALPAFQLSIEDPLECLAQELDAKAPAAAPRGALPDAGFSLRFRYDVWNNLGYTQAVLRETTALLYYRLRGWI